MHHQTWSVAFAGIVGSGWTSYTKFSSPKVTERKAVRKFARAFIIIATVALAALIAGFLIFGGANMGH